MSDEIKDHPTPQSATGEAPVAGHDAWFREQVEAGLKEAQDTPEACAPLEEVLKQLDL